MSRKPNAASGPCCGKWPENGPADNRADCFRTCHNSDDHVAVRPEAFHDSPPDCRRIHRRPLRTAESGAVVGTGSRRREVAPAARCRPWQCHPEISPSRLRISSSVGDQATRASTWGWPSPVDQIRCDFRPPATSSQGPGSRIPIRPSPGQAFARHRTGLDEIDRRRGMTDRVLGISRSGRRVEVWVNRSPGPVGSSLPAGAENLPADCGDDPSGEPILPGFVIPVRQLFAEPEWWK